MNIYDIAKEAGVSISTVSRVINNRPNIKPATRKRVEDILDKHSFKPSAIAQGLVTKNIRTVGILTIDIRVPHYASTAYALERELYKMGYNVILCNTHGETEDSMDYVRMLVERGVSGIILIGSVFQNQYIESSLVNSIIDIPFIIINSHLRAKNVYSVMINHEKGISLCIDHLLSKCREKIIYVQDADSFSGISKANFFLKRTAECGLNSSNNSVFKTTRSIMGGRDSIDRILESGQEFNAIIFGDDITAVGAVQRLKELGYRVPEDVSVIGWNNSLYASCCTPSLTSVDNKTELIGTLSIKLLESLIEGKQISSSITIDSELILREST